MKTREQYDDNEAQTRMVNAFCNAADGERLNDMVRAVIEIMHRVDRISRGRVHRYAVFRQWRMTIA